MDLPLPSNVSSYEHTIAGHGFSLQVGSVLYSKDDLCVYKAIQAPPKGDREADFYRSLFDCYDDGDKDGNGDGRASTLAGLRKFVPMFFGVFRDPVSKVRYIKLQDLLHGFARPSVMDVKMGAKSYEPSASPEKRDQEIAKYLYRDQIGFFVTGLRVWREAENRYERYSKSHGKYITPSNMHASVIPPLIGSVPANHRLRLLRPIVAELEAILAWFQAQDLFHFYASSILLAVESCSQALAGSGPHILVRMIDFTHVLPAASCQDEGYMLGLRTLISLCRTCEHGLAESGSEVSLN